MDSTMPALRLQLPTEPFALPLDELITYLEQVPDHRKRRGRRYSLAPLLALAVLAKLANHSQLQAIAEWASLRQAELTRLLHLPRPTMPHPTTWTRIFATVDPAELDTLLGEFFARRVPLGPHRPGDIQLTCDGKTLRGTIPAGACAGVHLVAAYLPSVGCVLAQLEVTGKANELTVAPKLLAVLSLEGTVVTGDALFAQRKLSAQIVAAGGDYLWTVKRNQAGLLDEIRWLLEPLREGETAAALDWRPAEQVTKAHGRLEVREIVVSSVLGSSSDWPGLEQVFKLTKRVTDGQGRSTETVRYGVTSLTAAEAPAARILELTRGHWGIEAGLHYRRDVTLGEDRSQVRRGHAAHVLASLNNALIGLTLGLGLTNLAEARRSFDYRFHKALHRFCFEQELAA